MDYSGVKTLRQLVDAARQHQDRIDDHKTQRQRAQQQRDLAKFTRKVNRLLPKNVQQILGARIRRAYVSHQAHGEWLSFAGDQLVVEIYCNDARYLLITREVFQFTFFGKNYVDVWALVHEDKIILEFSRYKNFTTQLMTCLARP